jgi:hypothetical protein
MTEQQGNEENNVFVYHSAAVFLEEYFCIRKKNKWNVSECCNNAERGDIFFMGYGVVG